MKEFRLQIRIKNNLLVKRREDLGLSVTAASKAIGVDLGALVSYENMKRDPLLKSGNGYKKTAMKIADFYRCTPEDLWPDTVRRVEKNRIEMEMSAEQIGHLSGVSTVYASLPPDELCELKEARNEVLECLECLTPREKDMVMRRWGIGGYDEHTLDEVGVHYGISHERVRRITEKVCRKLRWGKSNRRRLIEAMESMTQVSEQAVLATTFEEMRDERMNNEG